jgi:hypothetical protein
MASELPLANPLLKKDGLWKTNFVQAKSLFSAQNKKIEMNFSIKNREKKLFEEIFCVDFARLAFMYSTTQNY